MKFFGLVFFVLVGLQQVGELCADYNGYNFDLPFVGDSSIDEVESPRDSRNYNMIVYAPGMPSNYEKCFLDVADVRRDGIKRIERFIFVGEEFNGSALDSYVFYRHRENLEEYPRKLSYEFIKKIVDVVDNITQVFCYVLCDNLKISREEILQLMDEGMSVNQPVCVSFVEDCEAYSLHRLRIDWKKYFAKSLEISNEYLLGRHDSLYCPVGVEVVRDVTAILCAALCCADSEVFKTLVDFGADLTNKTKFNQTVLHFLAANQVMPINHLVSWINYVIDKCPELIQEQDFQGLTPLDYAMLYNGKTNEIVKTLLSCGALDDLSQIKHNPFAVVKSEGVAKVLLDAGMHVKCLCLFGIKPIHAVSDLGVMNFLIRTGSNVDEFDFKRKSPLHHCVDKKWFEGARVLIEAGASINIFGNGGGFVCPEAHLTQYAKVIGGIEMWNFIRDVHSERAKELDDLNSGLSQESGFSEQLDDLSISDSNEEDQDDSDVDQRGSVLSVSSFPRSTLAHKRLLK